MRALLLLALTAAAPAEDGITITKLEDIYPLLPPPGATKWDPAKVVEAVHASDYEFTPKHAYELVDRQVHPEIVKAVCAKAALFYDPSWKPMSVIAAEARRGQPAQTIPLTNADFVRLFEFFNDVKNELEAAEGRIGPLQAQQSSESVSMFERRARKRDEDLTRARGPHEGRIEATTFDLTLDATTADRDGCSRAVAEVDLSNLSFDLFRVGMGVKEVSNPVTVKSSSIESARFTAESPRRFEVLGRCGTKSTRLRMTLVRTWDGKWSGAGTF
jgi:hypothetical protein